MLKCATLNPLNSLTTIFDFVKKVKSVYKITEVLWNSSNYIYFS